MCYVLPTMYGPDWGTWEGLGFDVNDSTIILWIVHEDQHHRCLSLQTDKCVISHSLCSL